jgi:hypothetical protein
VWVNKINHQLSVLILYRVLLGKDNGERPFGKQRHRWWDSIYIDVKEIGWEGVDWI